MVLTYVDSSVALAYLFREPRAPPPAFWETPKVSSRLLEYEIWNRLHAHRCEATHGPLARDLLGHIQFVEMTRRVLSRALEAFPVPVRTLDGLHLATIDFLARAGEPIELASYDKRLLAASEAVGFTIAAL